MKRSKRRRENSIFTKGTAIAPILISVISLVFGSWQYFDKGRLDSELQKKDFIIKDLERRKLELENRQKEIDNSTIIDEFYIQDSLSVTRNKISFSKENNGTLLKNRTIKDEDFEVAYLRWLDKVKEFLMFKANIRPFQNVCYKEFLKFIKEEVKYRVGYEGKFTSYFLKNSGKNYIKDLTIHFSDIRRNDHPIHIDLLPPDHVITFIISIEYKTDYLTYLRPQDKGIEYYDDFQKTNVSIPIRPPNSISALLHSVVLENNNGYLTPLSVEGLPLLRSLLQSRHA